MEIKIDHPIRFIGVVILVVAFIGGACFFGGWKFRNPTYTGVEPDTELYDDLIESVDELRKLYGDINSNIEQLRGTTEGIIERFESGITGIEEGITGLENIITDSREAGDIARGIRDDIAEIRAASEGLAGIVGIEGYENPGSEENN